MVLSPFPAIIMFQRMITGIDNFVLVSIPLFILAGNLMNAGGITDRLFEFVRRLVGHVPGGLAHLIILSHRVRIFIGRVQAGRR